MAYNGDARESDGVFGKALGMAGVVLLTGGGAYAGVKAGEKLIKGVIKEGKEFGSIIKKGRDSLHDSIIKGEEMFEGAVKKQNTKLINAPKDIDKPKELPAPKKTKNALPEGDKPILLNAPGQGSPSSAPDVIHAGGPTVDPIELAREQRVAREISENKAMQDAKRKEDAKRLLEIKQSKQNKNNPVIKNSPNASVKFSVHDASRTQTLEGIISTQLDPMKHKDLKDMKAQNKKAIKNTVVKPSSRGSFE